MMREPFDKWWVENVVRQRVDGVGDVDIVFGSLVPYVTGEATARLAHALGKPWIVDLQDPWALDEMWLYPTELHRRIDLRRMRKVLALADAIVMNTPEAVERVRRAFPELQRKVVVSIPNGFDGEDFASAEPMRNDDKFRIVHTGYLHTSQGLRLRQTRPIRRILGGSAAPVDILTRSHVYLIDAINSLLTDDPSLATTLEVIFAGVASEADRAVSARSPVVKMLGYVPHRETVPLLRSADLLFLPMHDLPEGWRAGLVPGKTYEYLAAGPPILAAIPDGDARDLLTEAGNAYLCRPADVAAMKRIIRAEIARFRRGEAPPAPRPDVIARYERRRLTEDLATVFTTVLGRPARCALPSS
jgi:glycosyltransferase involved in cell wall biosynthesis